MFANNTWNIVDNLVTLQQVKQKNKKWLILIFYF